MPGQFKNAVAKRIRANVTTLPINNALGADENRTRILSDWSDAGTWYLSNAKIQGHSPASIAVRGQRFRSFAEWAQVQRLRPSDIETGHVRQFVEYCQSRQLSNFTINGKLRVLKTFYNELMAEGLYPINPASSVKRLREATNTVIPLTASEVKTLLSVFRQSDWVELRDYCITSIILDCGLRATEALRIKVDDLHLAEGAIFIPSTNAKGRKARTVFIGQSTTTLMKEWLAKRGTPTPWLFPAVYVDASGNYSALTRKAFYRRIVKYGQRAGLKHLHPHQLRHSYAIQYLVNSGGDLVTASRQLGHASLKVTERYMHVAESQAQKVLAQQHSLIDSLDKTGVRKRTRIIASRKVDD